MKPKHPLKLDCMCRECRKQRSWLARSPKHISHAKKTAAQPGASFPGQVLHSGFDPEKK